MLSIQTMEKLNIVVVYGSVREGRQGIKAAKFIVKKLEERKHKVTFIDGLEYNLPLLKKMYKVYEKGKAPKILEKLSKIMENADGIIIITGEYNHGPQPALKNILDHFQKEYFFKPSGIVCYSGGQWGGIRAGVQWRAILCEMGMPSTASMFPIPKVQDSFDDEGNPLDEEAYNRRAKKFLDEFEWYASALKAQRKKGTPY